MEECSLLGCRNAYAMGTSKLADHCHPLPTLLEPFKGYNVPELSKHRKRFHRNMNSDVLKKHARYLKDFLMSPWIKKREWSIVEVATEELAESIDSYATELSCKKSAVTSRNGMQIETASDDIAFAVLNVTNQYSVILVPLIETLKEKEYYEPVSLCDFAPINHRESYTYIKQLERGLPIKCIMITKSFRSSIGDNQYVWMIPQHVTMENGLSENQWALTNNFDPASKVSYSLHE